MSRALSQCHDSAIQTATIVVSHSITCLQDHYAEREKEEDKNVGNSHLPFSAFSLEATHITSARGPVLTKRVHGLFGENLLPQPQRNRAFQTEEETRKGMKG